MHTYTFGLKFPENHAANSDGKNNKYIVMILCDRKLEDVKPGESVCLAIEHGATPTAPVVMTHSDGIAVGHEKKVAIESEVIDIIFDRTEFKYNPILWSPLFEGERHGTPIFYEFLDDA